MLAAALRQNASWCALVCQEHGVGTRVDDRLLVTTGTPPPFYPHAMTLSRTTTAAEVVRAVEGRTSCGVKDSFAALDLAAAGMSVLLQASWLVLEGAPRVPPTGPRQLAPAPVRHDDVVALRVGAAGSCVAHRAHGVLGLQDVRTGGDPSVLAGLVAGAREQLGDLPVVGYEDGAALGTALTAGFVTVGELRVWTR